MQEEQQKEEEVGQVECVIHVDSSFTNSTARGGVVLVTLEKSKLEYAIRFRFKAINNEAEYEAMIRGLHLACTLGAKRVKVNNDSQLVVGQIQG